VYLRSVSEIAKLFEPLQFPHFSLITRIRWTPVLFFPLFQLPRTFNGSDIVPRDSAYPCCPGFFCLPNQVCMVPCIEGSVCRTSSWFCDNPVTLNVTGRTCHPFTYRSQHEDYHDDAAARAHQRSFIDRAPESSACAAAAPTSLPICPRGHYCPDTITMKPCEEGFFCREGSSEPRACPVLTTCGPRTSAPTNNSDRPRRVHCGDI
jgi:hypothetical protein